MIMSHTVDVIIDEAFITHGQIMLIIPELQIEGGRLVTASDLMWKTSCTLQAPEKPPRNSFERAPSAYIFSTLTQRSAAKRTTRR